MEKKEIQRLFRQHYAGMYRVARTILYDEQESQDVVSDVFEALMHSSDVLLPQTEEAYLLTSVRNLCFKRLRHLEVCRRVEGTLSVDAPAEEAEDERLADVIEFAVGHLSSQEQHIFDLRFRQGYSYEEIALSEGISKVAVWKHLAHLINEIKSHFNPHTR